MKLKVFPRTALVTGHGGVVAQQHEVNSCPAVWVLAQGPMLPGSAVPPLAHGNESAFELPEVAFNIKCGCHVHPSLIPSAVRSFPGLSLPS